MIKLACCFCSSQLALEEAVTLELTFSENETQQFFSHKKCFVTRIDTSIPLHPDLKIE